MSAEIYDLRGGGGNVKTYALRLGPGKGGSISFDSAMMAVESGVQTAWGGDKRVGAQGEAVQRLDGG